MENHDSNIKPEQTGGLKLMTVFIAVLALHVVVIGGFTVYHLLSAASSDSDMALDKNSKGAKALTDGSTAGDLPAGDTSTAEKASPPAAPSTETASAPATGTPATETPSTSAPVADAEPVPMVPSPTAQTPSGPIQHGPVIDPPQNSAPLADASSVAASPPPADSAPVSDGTPYTVKSGDSLNRIARQHHVAVAKLKAANSLTSNLLHIGQKIVIPNRTESVATTADSGAPSAVPAPAAASSDLLTPPDESTMPPTAPSGSLHHKMAKTALSSGHHLYTVVKGDTLIKIAHRFKTTPTAIMSANNLTDAGRLSIGKKLRIPSGESRSAATSSPASVPSAPAESKSGAKGQLANFVQ